MLIAIWPVIVLIIGLLLYLPALTNAKITEIGRLTFFIGLMWTVYSLVGKVFHVG